MNKLPYLPKAKGVDLQYRMKLIELANGFTDAYNNSKWYQFSKRKLCIGAIKNIYNSLEE